MMTSPYKKLPTVVLTTSVSSETKNLEYAKYKPITPTNKKVQTTPAYLEIFLNYYLFSIFLRAFSALNFFILSQPILISYNHSIINKNILYINLLILILINYTYFIILGSY